MPAQIPTFSRPVRYGGDPDVLRFLSFGVSIGENPLSVSQAAALHRFVTFLKAQNIWAISDALYPFVGGTSGWHSLNLKDPTTFRMIQNGTVVNDANGTQGNGINGYWDTTYDVGLHQENGGFFSVYSRTNLGADGMYDLGVDGSNTALQILDTINNMAGYYTGGVIFGSHTDSRGFFTVGCDTGGSDFVCKNGLALGNDFGSIPQPPTGHPIYFMANNSIPVAESFSTRQYSFLGFGNVYDANLDALLNQAVQTLQSALGRQV